MLRAEEIEREIFMLPDKFREHMRRKEYAQAKHCYDTARTVALFIRLEPEKCEKLFGSRQQNPPVEGMFQEPLVLKALEHCAVKRRQEQEAVDKDIRRRYGS